MMGDPVFGVDRESLDLVLLHFQADFSFQSGLKNQRQEEQEHHGFDPFYFLEQEGAALCTVLNWQKRFSKVGWYL